MPFVLERGRRGKILRIWGNLSPMRRVGCMAATGLRRLRGMRGSGTEVPKKEGKMTTSIKLAVPTMGAAGLNAERSGHFGHCDCFTVVDIVDGVG